jgi:hypothetical protein
MVFVLFFVPFSRHRTRTHLFGFGCLIIAAAVTPQSSNAKVSYTPVKIDVFLPHNGEALMETRL